MRRMDTTPRNWCGTGSTCEPWIVAPDVQRVLLHPARAAPGARSDADRMADRTGHDGTAGPVGPAGGARGRMGIVPDVEPSGAGDPARRVAGDSLAQRRPPGG